MYVITYPCWEWSYSILSIGVSDLHNAVVTNNVFESIKTFEFDMTCVASFSLMCVLWWINLMNTTVHYDDVIMSMMVDQITGLAIVYAIIYLSADQRKHQSSALLAFVRGIHRRPVNSPHKGPVTPKMFPFDDVIM